MRQVIQGKETELGFTLESRRSIKYSPEALTDMDFADDIPLLSDEKYQTQMLLHRVESETEKVG